MQDDKKAGSVVWFSDARGYGFLKDDEDGAEYFVHYSNIEGEEEYKTLVAHQPVTFVIGANKKGPQAEQVVVVGEPPSEDASQ
jgi:CspA family cold shock protein